MPRPALPFRHTNPHLKQLDSAPLPPVKYQILNCQGKDILVGRMKITTPTTSGHAFILRRFDTGAISLTTMFRAAFPAASDQEEKRETSWVKDNYDLSGLNGSSKEPNIIRLAGIWVSPEIALELAVSYSLTPIMAAITKAAPDPNGNYRRSGKGATGSSPKASPTPAAPTSKPLLSPSSPNPAKRRKELSPLPAPVPVRAISPARGTSPPPRRSTRLKSPTPKPPPARQVVRKSPTSRTRVELVVTPDGSDETAVEIDGAEDVAVQDLHAQDIAEQKAMIADLRAKRDAATKKVTGDDETSKLKRAREEKEVLQFEFKDPEVGERAIATNRKVSAFRLEPRTKAVAWGVAAFAVGLGAVSFLPNFL